ncbi:MAG: hypothetical protein METHSR3v1_540017 [Methanothrix sp.]|nr:MAG: hypothetical protein METHSR3v1_540017 [Methanothrix sp.]
MAGNQSFLVYRFDCHTKRLISHKCPNPEQSGAIHESYRGHREGEGALR